jgi:hypothetical protein
VQEQTNNFRNEIYFSIASEEELVNAFRLRDQKKLLLPDSFRFPMNVRSYLAWQEPSGVYTYLVFKMPNWDLPRGVAFKRSHSSGEPTGGLCNWCHAYGSSEEISMLSVTMSAKESRAYFLCQDLRCIEKIEEASMLGGKNPEKYIAELYHRIEKLFENLSGHAPD